MKTQREYLRDAQEDWHILDDEQLFADLQSSARLLSHEKFTAIEGFYVEYIPPGRCLSVFRFLPFLFPLLYALRLFRHCGRSGVLIVNGGNSLWYAVGWINRFLFRSRRRVLLWDVFVEMNSEWKRQVAASAMRGITLSVLWSKPQVETHARYLDLPEERFVFLPYKANHSKGPEYDLPIGKFIFAGGNGKRDYETLVEAVRETGIPTVISATAPEVRRRIKQLPNVIVLGAPEPAFAQLQAASCFVVIPMVHTGLKGGGEANFCNAMWHGKPVIAADSIAAADYIIDGETGYVVAAGDQAALRDRILELWNNPHKASAMGSAARRHVRENFTHDQFIRRLLRVAGLLKCDDSPTNELARPQRQAIH